MVSARIQSRLKRSLLLTKCDLGYKIKATVIGVACGTHVGRVRGIKGIGGKTSQKSHLGDLVLNGRIVLKRFLKRQDGALIGLMWHRTGTGGIAVGIAAMNLLIA